MPFGDWNGDGDVSAGETLGTGAVIVGLLSDDGGPEGGGGGVGCGEVCSGCFEIAVGFLLFVVIVGNLVSCVLNG